VVRYKMTVVFDVHEEVKMQYVYRENIDKDALKRIEDTAVRGKNKSHINNLYDDVIERIETSLKHPITYDIVSFEKLEDE
jgi:hypothetical protein